MLGIWVMGGCYWFVTRDRIFDAKDRDDDGFAAVEAGGDDCDDSSPFVHPNAVELCDDGIDNDCDGVPDDDGPIFFADEDRDGFGDPASPLSQPCLNPPGSVGNALDCDDTDDTIHPDAVDVCDAVDNDYDGVLDSAVATVAGDNYPTVEGAAAAAIAAPALGSVDVCPGSWSVGTIDVGAGESLTLRGVQGRDHTTLVEGSGGTVIEVTDDGSLVMEGLSITGSTTARAMRFLDFAEVEITDSRIHGNLVGGLEVKGDCVSGSASKGVVLRAAGTRLDDNQAQQGAGLMTTCNVDLRFVDCEFDHNVAPFGGGGILFESSQGSRDPLVVLESCSVTNNKGGGVVYGRERNNVFESESTYWGAPGSDDNDPFDAFGLSWSGAATFRCTWDIIPQVQKDFACD
ncbi:MAG: right-handed parallel beta-helix repeat-containing protein [Myxococcales bacterium]|nr:right-handed parallel beta-helix repeat-containing protein [Myxococcales bacterium]